MKIEEYPPRPDIMSPVAPPPEKPRRTLWIIGGIVALVVVVIGGLLLTRTTTPVAAPQEPQEPAATCVDGDHVGDLLDQAVTPMEKAQDALFAVEPALAASYEHDAADVWIEIADAFEAEPDMQQLALSIADSLDSSAEHLLEASRLADTGNYSAATHEVNLANADLEAANGGVDELLVLARAGDFTRC